MALVALPGSLARLFPGAPRTLEVEAGTVGELIDWLETRWPGMRDRLCEPGPSIRRHLAIFVDGERADLATPLSADADVRIIPAVSGGRRREPPPAPASARPPPPAVALTRRGACGKQWGPWPSRSTGRGRSVA